jgi:DNA topoisomerase II
MESDSDEYMSDAESAFELDEVENAPAKKVSKKSSSTTKSTAAPKPKVALALNPNAANAIASQKGKGKSKTVEEIYQKKSQLEHILLRPDTYSK